MVVPKFRDNFPGYDWAASFLRRHEATLSKRLCQNIKRNRARVSPTNINSFFDEYELTSEGIPDHLKINYDESAWADDPGRKKLIFKRGCKYPERVINQTKSSVSVMFAATASGVLLPPYVIYKATNLYDAWTLGGPSGCLFNRTKSGWMDASIFADWFKSVIIPYCRRFEGSKLLIGDNLSSHLSPEVVGLCEANQVLARLPQGLQQEVENENVTVNDSLTEYLKLMRYGNEGEPQKGRKKKLNVPAGRSVTSADFQPATLNDVAENLQDADTLSEGEQDELNDLGELGEPGPEADCALSEDEQDELGENDDELENVDTLNRVPGSGKLGSRQICKSDIFVFPDVSDERAFASQDVIMTLKEPSVRRGRYSFEPNPLI
ncbi:jerky protein homolog-like [Culex quinquefasciatus]|uniref:jerky protein homolog-like n=1 Tax=Culex quinquefasciatus TaxID=7176 RepID=UPI0018E300F6|nr:jerky protein homolog-like [Culex quinquefasciatus]